MLSATHSFVGVALVVVACGDNRVPDMNAVDASIAAIDVAPPESCWPDDGQIARGWGLLGTGRDTFEAMPAILPIEYGAQDGFDLVANVKMDGLVPGDPSNVLNPINPRTRVRAYFAATNIPLNYLAKCPYRYGYIPSADGHYQFAQGVAVVFETCWRAQHLIGQQVRIDLEIVDSDGGYATNSVTVTLAEPTTGQYPIEPEMPGCMH